VTRLDPQQTSHRFPQFLADGRHFLVYVSGDPSVTGEYLSSLDELEPRRLMPADAAAVVAPGHLLFGRGETLVAQPFDAKKLELAGEPFQVADGVAFEYLGQGAVGAWSASESGAIAYRTRTQSGNRKLIWFDRSGRALEQPGAIGSPTIANPDLSPDGRLMAFNQLTSGNNDVWVLDIVRGTQRRLTFNEGLDHSPLWSPDGSHLIFWSNRNGVRGLYQEDASGSGGGQTLYAKLEPFLPTDWSRDGRFVLCRELNAQTGYNLWIVPLSSTGGETPIPFASSGFQEREGKFSPDGRWVAYQSDESGRDEVYLQAFPGGGRKAQISTQGGAQPRFRADGHELFYIGLDQKMMAVETSFTNGAEAPRLGTPVELFQTRIAGGAVLAPGPLRHQYAVTNDGQRFLINTVTEEAVSSHIHLILHWKPQNPPE
jgi:dipeptidyl aminopeptidase/acylaminoacyl peptidase